MKKDIEWLKEEIGDLPIADTVFISDGVSYIDSAVSVMSVYDLIDQLDEPEVLSQDWIDKNVVHVRGLGDIIEATAVESLLVPKQEELESKIKVLIEAYKQEDGAYSNPENGWISGFVEDLENLVEEEQKYYAMVKGHELLDDVAKYWAHNKYDLEDLFISYETRDDSPIVVKNTKKHWNDLGINDSNADFVRVEEME